MEKRQVACVLTGEDLVLFDRVKAKLHSFTDANTIRSMIYCCEKILPKNDDISAKQPSSRAGRYYRTGCLGQGTNSVK